MMHQQNATSDDNHHEYMGAIGGGSTLTFPNEVSQMLPWTTTTVPSPIHNYSNNPIHNYPIQHHDPFIFPPPQPPPYGSGLFSRRLQQFGYEGTSSSTDHHHNLRFITESMAGQVVHPGSVAPFGLHAELQKMSAQEIMDAKALAASKSHSEAERRRRERINNHLAKLRSLLPNTTKTDKASLLAEVIQHVKDLKRQTSLIAETSPIPTETDELTVDNIAFDEEFGSKPVIKASICCEDRSDLLPDLIKTLKSLKLKTLKAEITTLGGRVKKVLFITGDDNDDDDDDEQGYSNAMSCNDGGNNHHHHQQQLCVSSVQEALKAVMEKAGGGDDHQSGSGSSVKRQRTNIACYP